MLCVFDRTDFFLEEREMLRNTKKWFGVIAAIAVCLAVSDTARAGTAWLQKQKLLASDGAAGDKFGYSVSTSGDSAIAGAQGDDDNGSYSGSAYIFKRDGTSWIQQAKLIASDGADSDSFGCSVSISGDLAIVGAEGDDDNGSGSGSAYIFKWNGTSWVEQQKLLASDGAAYDYFGWSVSISGDLAIVGAYGDDDNGSLSGSAYIFKWDGTSWVEQAKLLPSDGAAYDYFGWSVSISGDLAIVGAFYDDANGVDSGSAYIFKWDETNWVEQQKLLASDGAKGDEFGISVSISGDLAIAGAYGNDANGSNSGSAYIFKWNGTGWIQQTKLLASDGVADDLFGYSVSISGDLAIAGAYGDDDNGSLSGSAYIFKWDGTSWVEQQKLLASDGAAEDYFGYSVSISGDLAIAGAYLDGDNGNFSGSAYIFVPVGTGELTLLSPDGGEELVAGSTYDITWDTNDVVENIFIEYSANNGADWTTIDTVANIDSYQWLVPDINSNECLVWISDAGYPAAGDVSDNVFRIYVCTLGYDLNHNCFVDFWDFSIFVSEWLLCGDPCDPQCQPQ
jgi:hypothetical protein